MDEQTTPTRLTGRTGTYPEFTWAGVLVGYGIGILIAVSIGYLSLKLGFSIEGSELAAILGFGILRGLMRRNSIIENNIQQTLASAVNGASAGMMFSVPALFILGITDFNYPLLVLGCIAGGILGLAFIIPLRKQMIDYNRLAFPGGIATAAVLKSPGAGIHKAWLLVGGALVAALAHFISLKTGVENYDLGVVLGLPEYMNGIWYLSLLTVGVAFLAGKGGFFFIVGGYVCYWFLAPIMSASGILPDAATLQASGMGIADYLRLNLFRPTGIGMLIGGALMGIVLALPLVVSAIRSMRDAAKSRSEMSQDELPIQMLYMGVAAAFVVLAIISWTAVAEVGPGRGLTMALLGTLWIWVAGDQRHWRQGFDHRFGDRRRRHVRGHGPGHRPDARPEDGLPGGGDTEAAAESPVPRHVDRADHHHGPDRGPASGVYAWERSTAGAAGPGPGERDRGNPRRRRTA